MASNNQWLRGFATGAVAVGAGYLLVKKLRESDQASNAAAKVANGEPKLKAGIIDGKAIAQQVREEVKVHVAELVAKHGVTPGLAVVLVGSRKDSATYVRNKKKAAAEVGFHSVDVDLPEDATQETILNEVKKLNNDPSIHGILVQLPLPKGIDEAKVLAEIAVEKDADGFHVTNIGRLVQKGGEPPLAIACTPAGCIELLQRSGVTVDGADAVVLGRSNIVGMPVSQLLQSMNATVTVCHSRTQNLKEKVQRADILIAALGKAEMVRGDWLKPGCVVIDVGINAVDDSTKKAGYRLVGDVCFAEASEVASQITPVPGGVGPMTITMLLMNTLQLARTASGLPRIPLRRRRPSVENVPVVRTSER